MAWVKFATWDRWGELTRFRIAAEAALAAEHDRWATLPIDNPDDVVVVDPVQGGDFRCSLASYKAALSDTHLLYAMLLGTYVGLIEEHGRNLIEMALGPKQTPRSSFLGISTTLPDNEAAEDYVRRVQIEIWGARYLALTGWSWKDVGGGKAGTVEAVALRNVTSHGLTEVNVTAFNRMAQAGCDPHKWPVNSHVSLDRPTFNQLLQNLRAFGRKLSDCAAIL